MAVASKLTIIITTIFFSLSIFTNASHPSKTLVAPITKNAFDYYTIPLTPNTSAGFLLELISRPSSIVIDSTLGQYVTYKFLYNSSTCRDMGISIGGSCAKYDPNHPPNYCNPNVVFPRFGGCAPGVLALANITLSTSNYINSMDSLTVPGIYASEYDSFKGRLQSSSLAGMAGLTWSPLSLPSQLSTNLKIRKQFALCLPSNSSRGKPGVAFFGDVPKGLHSAARLKYTPLLKNPDFCSTCELNSGHYMSIESVSVNKKVVEFSSSFNSSGDNFVQISTSDPVTRLQSDIYQPIRDAFSNATSKILRVADPGKRYDLCFKRSAVRSTSSGYDVPRIDLKLKGGSTWAIYGANLLLDVSKHITCFAFVDGGPGFFSKSLGIFGGYQMENNFVVFDMTKATIGFSGLLLRRDVSCDRLDLLH